MRPEATTPQHSSRLSELLGANDVAGYALATRPRRFSFPQDHGPHPEYRNEWWYLTGNLDNTEGERFGFELTIFRFALQPRDEAAAMSSAWAANQVYIGHFAITDGEAERFHVAQRYARGALGLAGAEARPLNVWVEDWSLREGTRGAAADEWLLEAADEGLALSLKLEPLKGPVLNGDRGLSQKSGEPGSASYYYSIPRIRAEGTLSVDGAVHDVAGLAWLDREWGSSALSPEQEGWDWFALQLVDGSELMFYQLRRTDGTADDHSSGTWIPASGEAVHLARGDVRVEVRDSWDSPLGGRYPMAWTVSVAGLGLELDVDPVLEAQELSTSVRYWEGAVNVKGRAAGKPVEGRGYVELTGYAR